MKKEIILTAVLLMFSCANEEKNEIEVGQFAVCYFETEPVQERFRDEYTDIMNAAYTPREFVSMKLEECNSGMITNAVDTRLEIE